LELDASLPLAHTCLEMVYVQQSLYEEAAREFRVAAEIAPTDLTPQALIGNVCAVTGVLWGRSPHRTAVAGSGSFSGCALGPR
jgi:hypothetical protein